jgi:hypothetical protein
MVVGRKVRVVGREVHVLAPLLDTAAASTCRARRRD